MMPNVRFTLTFRHTFFNAAHSSNSFLFFDEADALFSKRSQIRDSHDRYANLEMAYLLQKTKGYDEFVILATNLNTSLDEAFKCVARPSGGENSASEHEHGIIAKLKRA